MPVANPRTAVAAILAACALACASGGSLPPAGPSPTTAPDSTSGALERTCEEALARVDELIALRDAEPAFPRDVLAEARALRTAAVDQLAVGDLSLALDLLESAQFLLEDRAE